MLVLPLFLVNISGCRPSSDPANTSAGVVSEKSAPQDSRPQIKVYVDEALLRKPHAILGGTVENVGTVTFTDLVVEVELKRRGSGEREVRGAAVTPKTLAPGEKGRYVLKVMSQEWGDFRVVRLESADRPGRIAFQALPGAPRPPERDSGTRTVTVEGPRRPSLGGDDFINTPDTPIPVP